MATLLLKDQVRPDDHRATSADTSWELGVSELDHLTYLAPMSVLLGEWPGDTNHCPNPSFEDGLTGWAKQLEGGSTVEADYSEGYDDGRSARMTRGTGICWLFEAVARAVSEGWQTVFLRVKGTPGARFVGRLHNYSGGAGSVYGPTLVLDGTWQVYTFSQYREAGSYRLILHLETNEATCNVDTVSIRYAAPVLAPADDRRAQVELVKTDGLGTSDAHLDVWTARRIYTDSQASQDARLAKPGKLATETQGTADTWSRIWAAFGKLTESNMPGDFRRAKVTTPLPRDAVTSSDVRQVVAKRPVGVEAINLADAYSDAWSVLRTLGETQVGSDSRWVSAKPRCSEATAPGDNRWAKIGKQVTDAQVVMDALVRVWNAIRQVGEVHALVDARKATSRPVLGDVALLGDNRSAKAGKPLADVEPVADVWTKVWNAARLLAEIGTPWDARRATARPWLNEASTPGDDKRAQIDKWTSEVEVLVEVLNRAWTAVRTFAEGHSPGDVRRTRFLTSFIESQPIGETWARTWSAFLTVGQAVAPVDVVRKLTRRTLAELQAASETLASLWTAFLRPGEALTPSDTERAKVRTPKAESVGLYDTRLAKPGLKVTDAQGLVESWSRAWQALRQLPDSLGAADALQKTGRPGFVEGVATIDTRTAKPGKKAGDAIGLVGQLATVWTAFVDLFEALIPGDARGAKTALPVQETTTTGDARTARTSKTATDVILPQVDLATLWQAFVQFSESPALRDAEWALARLKKAEATALGASFGSVFSARRLFAEASGMVDALAHRVKKIAGDLMQALDGLRARIGVQRSEGVTATGALLSRAAKPLEDVTVPQVAHWSQTMVSLATDVAASDAFGRAWSAFLAATESTKPGTSLRFATMLPRSETVAVNAVHAFRATFTLAESAALAVLLSWRAWLSWTFSEALAAREASRAWVASLRSEAQATVDGLAKSVARAFGDMLTASGSFAAKVGLIWGVSVAVADGLWQKVAIKKTEASAVADLRSVAVRQLLPVAQELADAYDHAAQFVRVLSDQAGLTEVARWVAKLLRPEQATAAVDARGLVRAFKTDTLSAVVLRYGRAVKSVAESLTFTDWIRSQTAKLTTDFAVLFATATQQVGLRLSEARVLGADAWSAVTKLVTEASVTADTIARRWAITRVWSVAVSLADVRKLKVSKPVQDVLAILDVLGRAWQAVRSWTDVAALNLLAHMRSSKLVQESVTVWQLLRALVMLRKLDSASPGDELRKRAARLLSDDLKVIADQALRTGKALGDLVTPSLGHQFTIRAWRADATILETSRRMFVVQPLPSETQTELDAVLRAAGKSLADVQASEASIAQKTVWSIRDEALRMWDWWARKWRAIRSAGDLVSMSDARAMFYRRLARDITGLADGMTKAVGKAIQLVQSISEWFRQRFLGIYRRYTVRTLSWDATVQEQPWALAVQEVDSQPRVLTTAWPAQARQIGWAQIREVGPRVLEMLVGEKRNVQLLVEAADGQPIQVDSQPPVVIEFLDGNQVKQDFGWVETGNKVFYAFAPEQPGQYVLEFTISVDNGRQVLKHRVSVHVKS